MTKVCVELSNFVIFSEVATFGMLVCDQASYNGSYLSHMKGFCSEVWQSVFNGEEQTTVKANEARTKSSNDENKRTCEIFHKNAECSSHPELLKRESSLMLLKKSPSQ